MTKTLQELETLVLQFKMLQLPGQPSGMHMGTSYLVTDLLDALKAALAQQTKSVTIESWTDIKGNRYVSDVTGNEVMICSATQKVPNE